jgi:hypothetical protein
MSLQKFGTSPVEGRGRRKTISWISANKVTNEEGNKQKNKY